MEMPAADILEENFAPSSDAEEGQPSRKKGGGNMDRIIDGPEESTTTITAAAYLKDLTPVMKPLMPLVAMPPPSEAAVNNRLSKQIYSRIGRNLLFEARPAVSSMLTGFLLSFCDAYRASIFKFMKRTTDPECIIFGNTRIHNSAKVKTALEWHHVEMAFLCQVMRMKAPEESAKYTMAFWPSRTNPIRSKWCRLVREHCIYRAFRLIFREVGSVSLQGHILRPYLRTPVNGGSENCEPNRAILEAICQPGSRKEYTMELAKVHVAVQILV